MDYERRFRLSDEMRVALGMNRGLNPYAEDVLVKLTDEVGISPQNDEAMDVIEALLDPLEDVLREGPPPVLEDRGRRVADAAIEGLDVATLYRATMGLGWGRERISPREVRGSRTNFAPHSPAASASA